MIFIGYITIIGNPKMYFETTFWKRVSSVLRVDGPVCLSLRDDVLLQTVDRRPPGPGPTDTSSEEMTNTLLSPGQ